LRSYALKVKKWLKNKELQGSPTLEPFKTYQQMLRIIKTLALSGIGAACGIVSRHCVAALRPQIAGGKS